MKYGKRLVKIMCAIGLFPALAMAAQKPPKNVIPMEQARQKAQSVYSGDIKSEELEFEHKLWVYSFDIKRPGDANVHEVQINALTGKLVSQKTETPSQEKAEGDEEKRVR